MILDRINSSISIDQIIFENSENYVHFLTHIDKTLCVPKDWRSFIYTSSHIFKFLWLKDNSIDQKYFRILQKDESTVVQLQNNVKIKVTMFEICSITGNVAFHFEASENNALYVGPFGMCQEMLLNSRFQQYVKNNIHLLYVDNTRSNSVVETNEYFVAEKLNEILCEHPGYQILLHIPPYGYEELILKLLIQFGFKICAGEVILEIFKKIDLPVNFEMDMKKAQIILGEECITAEKIKRRFQQKRLTVRIIESNNHLINYDLKSIGLYQINWSPHPSLFQLHHLISFIRPRYVKEIYQDMPKLPEILHSLCIRKRKFNANEPSNHITIIHNQVNTDTNENNDNNDDRHINCNTGNKSSEIKIKLSESALEENRKRNVNMKNDEEPNKNPKTINCPLNDKNNENNSNLDEIITISSTDSEQIYHQQRIRLPRRRDRGSNRYDNRVVGIVTPIRVSQNNDDEINFMEFNQLQNVQDPDVVNNSIEEENNLMEKDEEEEEDEENREENITNMHMEINDYFYNDCGSVSTVNYSHSNKSFSQNEQSTTIDDNMINNSRNNENDNNKKITSHSNAINCKIRVKFGVKCKQLIYDDDDSP